MLFSPFFRCLIITNCSLLSRDHLLRTIDWNCMEAHKLSNLAPRFAYTGFQWNFSELVRSFSKVIHVDSRDGKPLEAQSWLNHTMIVGCSL